MYIPHGYYFAIIRNEIKELNPLATANKTTPTST